MSKESSNFAANFENQNDNQQINPFKLNKFLMKKNYSTPETQSLEVMAHDIICASGAAGAPGRSGSIGDMGQIDGDWE